MGVEASRCCEAREELAHAPSLLEYEPSPTAREHDESRDTERGDEDHTGTMRPNTTGEQE